MGREQFLKLRSACSSKNAMLVAVSKTRSNEQILELYHAGQRAFGENRVAECVEKMDSLPNDIEWHFIGHLQRNKVKYIASGIDLIHSVDSQRLLEEINKQALKHDRVIEVLLQFHIADEENKYGFDLEEAEALLNETGKEQLSGIQIVGVMGMATYTEDTGKIRNEFRSLKKIFDKLKQDHFFDDQSFKHISMGMSGDYEIALEEGSTMLRVGSLLFS